MSKQKKGQMKGKPKKAHTDKDVAIGAEDVPSAEMPTAKPKGKPEK